MREHVLRLRCALKDRLTLILCGTNRFRLLPITVEATTGGGGCHFYFARPGHLIRNHAGLGQGIDLRGDGGYIVAPPSIQPSGKAYEWTPGHSPDEIELAPFPRWLFSPSHGAHAGLSISEWRQLVREGVAEGQRNSTIASLTGHLLWRNGIDVGVEPDALDDAEVAAVVESIAKLHEAEASLESGLSFGEA